MSDRARHYVAWLDRYGRAVHVVVALAVVASGVLIATRLPIKADFANLLPDDAPSVKDLKRIEARNPAKDTTLVILRAPDADTRRAAAAILVAGLRRIPGELVERIEDDDAALRNVIRAHRFLYPTLGELTAAHDALKSRIERADTAPSDDLQRMQKAWRDAAGKLDHSSFISADDRAQLVVVRTAFRATDVPRDRALRAALDGVFADVRAAQPAVELGLAGGVPSAIAEHDAVAHGMAWSSAITSLLVGVVLLAQVRRKRWVALVGMQIVIATVISFGLAAVTVGHLNSATAFLGAIIAGNGINYGILLVARFAEERRRSPVTESVVTAIAATARPTLVASLGASIAYGALFVTRFRGFSDFAVIGGLGMVVCWVVAYTLLPLWLLRTTREPGPEPIFGRIVLRALGGQTPRRVFVIAGVVTMLAGYGAWRYVHEDPFEYDMAKIRSDAPAALEARRWMAMSDTTFGRGFVGRVYFAVDHEQQVAPLVAQLRAANVGRPRSIEDLVPPDQARKIEVLGAIRKLLEHLDFGDPDLRELVPPEKVESIGIAGLPPDLVGQFRERDGRVGLIVALEPSFDPSDGRAMIRFAEKIRGMHLSDVAISGSSLVFADILEINRGDGLLVTGAAAIGLIVMVLLVVGRNRKSVAVLAATACGSLLMISACAMVGLKVNFLDFVALPIALGLGVDYAINIAERVAQADLSTTLRATGGAVLVCSLTTMIGYASLLVSDNHAIRDFGLASLLGELTCVITALTVVPSIARRRA